jgi:hypothetical protein
MKKQIKKPKILWLCDVRGWAFYNRTKQISSILKQHAHEIIYISDIESYESALRKSGEFDIIISWFVNMTPSDMSGKLILGLTGGRVQRDKLKKAIENE